MCGRKIGQRRPDGPFPLRVILVDWRGAIIRPRYRPRGSTARVGVLNDRYFFFPREAATSICCMPYLSCILSCAHRAGRNIFFMRRHLYASLKQAAAPCQ